MRSHAWRPLIVVIVVVLAVLVVRHFYVPADFGVHDNGFMYGWYRTRSIWDWKNLETSYRGKQTCEPCHQKNVKLIAGTPHAIIQCENCHGPNYDHPTDPKKLPLDRSRALCLRCHEKLAYPGTARGGLRGIDNTTHHPGRPCADCHNPHHPNLTPKQTAATSRTHGNDYCRSCHTAIVDTVTQMPHKIISCEDCHGKAGDHPSDPAKLTIDTSRDLCLGCHTDKTQHNAGRLCITCHDPHKSSLQFLQFLPQPARS